MLKAYFDESGRDDGVFALGGFVAPEDRWHRIEAVWNKELGSRTFRMSHWERREGDFESWPSDKRRTPLIASLINSVQTNIQNKHSLGTSHAVIFKMFQEIFCPTATAHQAKRLAYGCLLMACLGDILRAVAIPSDGLTVICERLQGVTGFAAECFDKFKTDHDLGGKFHGIEFCEKEAFRGLQTGDLLAYEGYKYITDQVLREPTRPIRKSFAALLKSQRLHLAYAGDRDRLLALRTEYDSLPPWPETK